MFNPNNITCWYCGKSINDKGFAIVGYKKPRYQQKLKDGDVRYFCNKNHYKLAVGYGCVPASKSRLYKLYPVCKPLKKSNNLTRRQRKRRNFRKKK